MRSTNALPWDRLEGLPIHMVGIKGNGMAALAATLHGEGATLSGSDTAEVFFTDEVLKRIGVPVPGGFAPEHVPAAARLVIHSPAFDPASNPELLEAARRGIPILSYPQALGAISGQFRSAAISGSHGKTSTTALAAVLSRAIGLPATVLVPSLLPDLGGLPVYRGGREYFVTETCEYRRHFHAFRPRWIVVTNVEAEHLDYYRDLDDVADAFVTFARKLPPDGALIYNSDDPGCRKVVEAIDEGAVRMIPVGRGAEGEYRITSVRQSEGRVEFRLAGAEDTFALTVPGAHNAANATQALALVAEMTGTTCSRLDPATRERMRGALLGYRGCKRRAERVGEVSGITVLDDYGHHPTEIRTTLEGLKQFYTGRRLVVDFMPHLYSRTRTLFGEFVACFDAADEVLLHRIYPSARERDDGTVSGRMLADAVALHRPGVRYFETHEETVPYLTESLRAGDVLVTMGAGDNWRLGVSVLEQLGGGRAA